MPDDVALVEKRRRTSSKSENTHSIQHQTCGTSTIKHMQRKTS